MNVLIVYAHPEPRSFNGALKEVTVETLAAAGHEVVMSDLYAMGFAAVGALNRPVRLRSKKIGACSAA